MNKLQGLLGNAKKPDDANKDSGMADAPKDAPAKATPKLAGLKLAGSAPKSRPAPTQAASGARNVAGSKSVDSSDDNQIASLADLENTTVEGNSRPSSFDSISGFSDEIDATKPVRDLSIIEEEPDEQTRKGMQSFVDLLDGVYDLYDDPEMLGQVTRNIMIELKNHPQYMKLRTDDDVRAWIQGMRASMGLAKIKKETKKSTRSSGKGKKIDLDMLADLESMDLGDLS